MTENELYIIIKNCLPQTFKPRFNIAKTTTRNADGTVNNLSNLISIYIKSAESPDRTLRGNYIRNKRRVVFNIYTDRGGESQVDAGYNACNTIKQGMNSLIGTQGIIDCRLLIDSNYLGLTDQGVHCFSLEYKVTLQ